MVERYRVATAVPISRHRDKPNARRKRKKKQQKVRKTTGAPRGRPLGSKANSTIKLRRIMEAVEADKLLPHEFFLLVLNRGMAGGTLGKIEKDGKMVPNVVTFDQMMLAAIHGVRYFSAPIRVEHGGPGGGPLQVFHIPAERLENLETEELKLLQVILPKLGGTVKTIEHEEGDGDEYAREIGMLPVKDS